MKKLAPITYNPRPTTEIRDAISQSLIMGEWLNRDVRLKFNQHQIIITQQDSDGTAMAKWDAVQKPSA